MLLNQQKSNSKAPLTASKEALPLQQLCFCKFTAKIPQTSKIYKVYFNILQRVQSIFAQSAKIPQKEQDESDIQA